MLGHAPAGHDGLEQARFRWRQAPLPGALDHRRRRRWEAGSKVTTTSAPSGSPRVAVPEASAPARRLSPLQVDAAVATR